MATRQCRGCPRTVHDTWWCGPCKAARGRRVLPPRRPGAPDYGAAHQRKRKAERESAYGTPCCRCGRPMVKPQKIHLDHRDDDPTQYLGWSHATCNIRAGAIKGRARQLGRPDPTTSAPAPAQGRPSRDW